MLNEKKWASSLEQLTQENKIKLQTAIEAVDMLLMNAVRLSRASDYNPEELISRLGDQIEIVESVFPDQNLPKPFLNLIKALKTSIKTRTYERSKIYKSIEQARSLLYDE